DRDAVPARGLVEAVQDVLLAAGVRGQAVVRGEARDGLVGRLLGGRDDHALDAGDAARALDQPREHRAAGDIGERLAGEPGRAQPGLHDRGDHRPIATGRPATADAFAASATSRIASAPAASTTGAAPSRTQRAKWCISSRNIWLRSVLIDSWKTSRRRSSLPYTVTDCPM